MKAQSYYRIRHNECNICSRDAELLVNCAGFSCQVVRTKSSRYDYYLMYVTDGEMNFALNSVKGTIRSGQFMLIPPETVYFFKTPENKTVSYFWLHFTGSQAENFLIKCRLNPCRLYDAGLHQTLFDLWRKMWSELILQDSLFNEVSTSLLKEILSYFSRYAHSNSISQVFSKSIVYIHENYSGDISVSELAEKENLCLTSYRKQFREVFGVTAKEYIIDVRLNHASRLLLESDMKTKEIAATVGYSDVYYFSRIFKKKLGVSPSAFRKNAKN